MAASNMTEPLDVELLQDVGGLGKPPSFDGNDADYQDFRFSFRIHMSLVSTVSQQSMDKCEIERNPICLVAVNALGDAHMKCCTQLYFSLALFIKGSVRTLVRSVEEYNGAEAWRLIRSRYAPDTQNRQCASMQKIMMRAKLWCDHAEGFDSGLRAWELDVGEWERASGTGLAVAVKYTVMTNMAPIFFSGTVCSWARTPTVPLFEELCCNGVSLPETLERIRPCQLEMERAQMMTRCNSTLSRKARARAKANTTTRKEIARPARPTRALQTSTRARTVAELDTGRRTAGDQVEEHTTIPPATTATPRKARVTREAEGICFLTVAHSFAHVRVPGQKEPLLDLGIHTASGARLQHDGGRLVTYKLPDGRTIRVLFHACAIQKPTWAFVIWKMDDLEEWSVLQLNFPIRSNGVDQ